MRIAYVSTSTVPSREASSIHVMKMCQAFVQEGHQVTLYAPHVGGIAAQQSSADLSDHYGIDEDFRIVKLGASRSMRSYDYSVRAAVHAKRTKRDLVYSRNIAAASLAAWLGMPTVHEVHEPPHHTLSRLAHRSLVRAPGFRRFVIITHALKNRMLELIPSEPRDQRVIVLPDGVDLERFDDLPEVADAQQQLGLAQAPLTVGYAGHLYAGRGIEVILELAERLPEYQFMIMGGEDTSVTLFTDKAARRGLENITFLGFIANAKLPIYQAACDVLLMPYQRHVAAARGGNIAEWTSPMKMFEYMASGRLIISSDLPVLREVLNEKNSVLCPPNDLDRWEAALRRATSNSAWRRKLGSQAKQDVASYTWRGRASLAVQNI